MHYNCSCFNDHLYSTIVTLNNIVNLKKNTEVTKAQHI